MKPLEHKKLPFYLETVLRISYWELFQKLKQTIVIHQPIGHASFVGVYLYNIPVLYPTILFSYSEFITGSLPGWYKKNLTPSVPTVAQYCSDKDRPAAETLVFQKISLIKH